MPNYLEEEPPEVPDEMAELYDKKKNLIDLVAISNPSMEEISLKSGSKDEDEIQNNEA